MLPFLIFLFWPFYQLSQLPQSWVEIIGFRLYAFDLLVFVFLALNIKKIATIFRHPLFPAFGLFFLSLAASFIGLKTDQILPSFFYLLRLLVYPLMFFLIKPSSKLKKAFIYSLFLIPITGLAQYLILPDLRFLKAIGFDDHYFRLTLPFLDPNFTAAALAGTILLAHKNLKKKINLSLISLSLLALALTFSRAGFVSLVAGVVFLILKSDLKLKVGLLVTIISLASLVVFAPKPAGEGVNLLRAYSIQGRLVNFSHNLGLISQNPISGLGFGPLNRRVDNSYLFVLVTAGSLGFASFINLSYKIFTRNKNKYFQAALIALATHSLFNNSLFYTPIILFILLNLSLSEHR